MEIIATTDLVLRTIQISCDILMIVNRLSLLIFQFVILFAFDNSTNFARSATHSTLLTTIFYDNYKQPIELYICISITIPGPVQMSTAIQWKVLVDGSYGISVVLDTSIVIIIKTAFFAFVFAHWNAKRHVKHQNQSNEVMFCFGC